MTTGQTTSPARRAIGGLAKWSARLVMFTIVAALIGAITVLMILPRATHGTAMTVLTGSMTPEIPVGSTVLVRPVDPSTLEVGDIATYQPKPGVESYITHRIVGIDTKTTPTSFTFKGDANKGPDLKPVPAGAVRGEVWFHVPYLGAIRDALYGKGGIMALAMVLLGAYAVSQLVSAIGDSRRARRRRPAVDGPAPVQVTVDHPLVVATFSTHDSRFTPYNLAAECGAVLLSHDEESFTILTSQQQAADPSAIQLLERFGPTSIRVLDGSVVFSIATTTTALTEPAQSQDSPTPMPTVVERDHAVA